MGTDKKESEKRANETGRPLIFEKNEFWAEREALGTILDEGAVRFVALILMLRGEEALNDLSKHYQGKIYGGKIMGTIYANGDGKPRLEKPPPENTKGEVCRPGGFDLYDGSGNVTGTLYPDMPTGSYDKAADEKKMVAIAKIYVWFVRAIRTGEIKTNPIATGYLLKNSFLEKVRKHKAEISEILKTGGLEIDRSDLFDSEKTALGGRHAENRKYKKLVRGMAQKIWEQDKSRTIESIVNGPELRNTLEESYFTDKTLWGWIKDLAPNRRPGRRPKTLRRRK